MAKIFTIAAFVILAGITPTLAHGPASPTLNEIYGMLGVREPTILPDNRWYFLKEWNRGVERFFTFDAVKKSELELRIADEKLAELETLVSKKPNETDARTTALQNYLEAQSRLNSRLEALKGKNKNVDLLLEKLADRVIEHEKLFEALADDIGVDTTERAVKGIGEITRHALNLDAAKVTAKLREKIKTPDDYTALETIHDESGGALDDLKKELETTAHGGTAEKSPPPQPSPPPRNDEPLICAQIYDPVCGKDGKTYPNACVASAAGVPVHSPGECGRVEGKSPPPAPTPAMQTFSIAADDRGFYPSGIITVPKKANVKITFSVRTTNVYYGGLDFRSKKFNTPSIKPGDSYTVEFTADESFDFTSYWPLSNVEKQSGKVVVKE